MPSKLEFQMKYENYQIKSEKIPIWFAKIKTKKSLAVISKIFSGYNLKIIPENWTSKNTSGSIITWKF